MHGSVRKLCLQNIDTLQCVLNLRSPLLNMNVSYFGPEVELLQDNYNRKIR